MKRYRKTAGKSMMPVAVLTGMAWAGAGLVAPLQAQSYSIEWYKITGGHGTSTNGQFSVTGTVGQADAHETFRGGNYALTGGFWSFISAVQTPGAPELSITLSGPQTVVISWPAPSSGFVLQQNSNLNAATWVEVTNSVTSTPSVNEIEIKFLNGNNFYRLIRP